MPQFKDQLGTARADELRREEETRLIKSLASRHGYSYINLPGVTINPEAMQLVDEATARASNLVVFERTRDRISVAIRNPNNQNTKDTLAALQAQGLEPTIYMTSTASLEHGWERYKDQLDTEKVKYGVLDINSEEIADQVNTLRTPEQVRVQFTKIQSANNARRISETLETMFAGALALGSSDIHIEPEEGGIRLRYRLDGVLHDITDLDRAMYGRLTSRLKLLSGMILNITNEAQDGRFTFSVGEREVEVRSSIIPGASGESMVMRLLDPTVASFSMESLGLNPILHKVMATQLERPNGLIITTGPTGSGKTTALYAFLRQTHKSGVKIITIENPVEYKLDDIVQTQVSDDYTFASGLRAVLRQDPDIIMVGEIRDREVAETAIHAAQTGHLVFSTLHTNSAVGAFPRLIDLGVDYRIIGSSVNIVLGQRLVRVLCDDCKRARAVTPEEASLINTVLATHPAPPPFDPTTKQIYEAVGCTTCNKTGFKGRQGVFEAIIVDDAVEAAIINDPREHIIYTAATAQGIPTMAEDGMEKVLSGITSLAELKRVIDLQAGRHQATTSTTTVATTTNPTPNKTGGDDFFASHVV